MAGDISDQDKPRIVDFEPGYAPSTNGHRTGRRVPILSGVTFGFLIGALLGTSAVARVQWLNLASVGSFVRPVLVALGAGAMVGLFRRDSLRFAVIGGALAALLSLWGVYGLIRLSIRVLFVERSLARVVTFDLLRLLAYAVPAGATGALAGWSARTGIRHFFRRSGR